MDFSTLLLFAGVLVCPIVMGAMMWMMSKNMGDSHSSDQTTSGHPRPANSKERLTTLQAQQQILEAEVAEVSRLVDLEAQREALSAAQESTKSKSHASTLPNVD